MRKLIYLSLASCMLVLPPNSFAVELVRDNAAIGHLIDQYHQLEKEYTKLQETYDNAVRQLDELQRTASDLEGHYKLGDILDSSSDFADRSWSPQNWDDALKDLAGGNEARYKELVDSYEKKQSNPKR